MTVQRPKRRWTLYGKTTSVYAIGQRAGLSYSATYSRLRAGETPEDIVESGRRGKTLHTVGGEPTTIAGIAALAGLSRGAVDQRLRAGETADQIVQRGRLRRQLYLHGKRITHRELAARTGISDARVGRMLQDGLAPEQIIAGMRPGRATVAERSRIGLALLAALEAVEDRASVPTDSRHILVRCLAIISALAHERDGMTLEELVARTGHSRPQAQRDLETIRGCGLPVHCDGAPPTERWVLGDGTTKSPAPPTTP